MHLLLVAIECQDQELGLPGAGDFEKISSAGVAIENLQPQLAQQVDPIGVVLEYRGANPVCQEEASDDAAKAAESIKAAKTVLESSKAARTNTSILWHSVVLYIPSIFFHHMCVHVFI